MADPRQRSRGFTHDSGGFAAEQPDGRTAPDLQPAVIVRRRPSSGIAPAPVDRRGDAPSGGFSSDGTDGTSYPVAPGIRFGVQAGALHAGVGHSGGPPTQEIDAAQTLLRLNLAHDFATLEPLAAALTHPSWRHERADVTTDNQRLEFLGDLVIGLAVGELLLLRLPNSAEGDLSVLKAQLVRERTLAEVAEEIGIGPALRLGRGEELGGGRKRPAILADALEAVIAAVFIDAGYAQARALVERLLGRRLGALLAAARRSGHKPASGVTSTTALHATTSNYKTALQEWLARARAVPPSYKLVCELGPPEARRFRVQVETRIDGKPFRALGEATTMRAAENAAAEQLFRSVTGE